MQIFEVTRPRRTNEGVLGALGKVAKGVSAAAAGTGAALADKFVRSTLPGVSLYGDEEVEKLQQKLQPKPADTTPAPAATTTPAPAATTTPAPAATTTPAKPAAPAGQSWVGTNTNVPAVVRKQQAQQTATPVPAAKPAAPAATPAAKPAPAVNTGVVVSPGHRIVVQAANGGKYYKTQKGWTNEIGQAVTNTGSIATLEKLADAAGREERIPTAAPTARAGKPVKTRKRR